MKVALVIPAAGRGERLGHALPKALVPVGPVSLLRRTLERLAASATFSETVVLAPADALADFERALASSPPSLGLLKVRPGGATRQQSVSAGLAELDPATSLVCVHDAARPLVAPETVRAVIEQAAASGAATAARRPSDSVRQDDGTGRTRALDRATVWLVETPQVFDFETLRRAHLEAEAGGKSYTDDASLVEAVGQHIQMVESSGRNLKVTVRADLDEVARLLA